MANIFGGGGAKPAAPVLATPAAKTLTPRDASPAAAALAAARAAEEEKKRKKGQGTVLGGDFGQGGGGGVGVGDGSGPGGPDSGGLGASIGF